MRSPFIPVILLALALSSCTKVIDIDLNSAEKKIVIEANLSDRSGDGVVLISRTKNFDEDNSFEGVTGATVTITPEGGFPVVLLEIQPGTYTDPQLKGIPGKRYDLLVTTSGSSFSATSIMPAKVNLDTIYVTDEFLFTDTRKVVNTEHVDPVGRGNQYRFIQYINGNKDKQLQIQNDDYTDGRKVNSKLFTFSENDDDEDEQLIKSGDMIRVVMQSITPDMYRYWFSVFRSSNGSSGQATPANPVTNIRGGALGYFSAHTFQEKTMQVP